MNETCPRCGSHKIDGKMLSKSTAEVWCVECEYTWYEEDLDA